MSGDNKQARWRCETCKSELTMPAGFAEWGYACCYASMTFLGVEPISNTLDQGSDQYG